MEYRATKDGKIINAHGKVLKPYTHTDGYKQFKMYDSGKTTPMYVHRYVWICHKGNIQEGMQINHINSDKTDNRLENLEMITHTENIRKREYCKLSMNICKEIRNKYMNTDISMKNLGIEYGVHETTIHNCIHKITWS